MTKLATLEELLRLGKGLLTAFSVLSKTQTLHQRLFSRAYFMVYSKLLSIIHRLKHASKKDFRGKDHDLSENARSDEQTFSRIPTLTTLPKLRVLTYFNQD